MSLLDLTTKVGGCALAYRVSPAWSPTFRFSGFPFQVPKGDAGYIPKRFMAVYGLSSRNTKSFPGTNRIYAPHGLGQTHGSAQGSKLSLVYKDW